MLAVVTRYFGGTLLGTGGLIRAYGGCVRDAVQQAHLVERRMLAVVRFEVDHAIAGRLTSLLHASEFPDVAFEYQADRVVGTIHLDQETTSDFERWVAEQTNGTAITEIIGEAWREVLLEKTHE